MPPNSKQSLNKTATSSSTQKKSLLYHQNSRWTKKNTNDTFDATMGSYDGAETCELIGTYMLSLIASKFKDEVGLYRDDGLTVSKATPKEIERPKKEVSNVFKSNGLKITIDANKKIVHFLDVTFELTDGSYKPYMKPNNKLSYIQRQSNHPPALLKNIPLNINKRRTDISSSKEVFDESIAPYQQANTPTPQPDTCTCRKKPDCPLEGKCLQTNVIYQAIVTTETTTETYVGLATNYRNHKTSRLSTLARRNETELSKYVWNLRDAKKPFQIKWKILKKCTPYSNISKNVVFV